MMTLPLCHAILVVDDDVAGREMLVEYLQFKGFTVHESSNGATALALADALRPRVILMDLAMPHLDGLETTRRLRTNPRTRDATIVAVSGWVFAADREAAYRAGCNFFIPKPYALATLAKFVGGLVRLSAPEPQAAGGAR